MSVEARSKDSSIKPAFSSQCGEDPTSFLGRPRMYPACFVLPKKIQQQDADLSHIIQEVLNACLQVLFCLNYTRVSLFSLRGRR